MSEQKTEYVYNGILVVKTGRTAHKSSSKQTLKSTIKVEETIVEIVPVDLEDGTWKRWVTEQDLFVVTNA